jgi:hypothetical protein
MTTPNLAIPLIVASQNQKEVTASAAFKKAKVAVARKLSVILHRMWRDGTEFRPAGVAAAAA